MTETVRNTWGIGSGVASKEFIAGVELEIEDIQSLKNYNWETMFSITEDGSLRNNGKEFISKPLDLPTLVHGFKSIHGALVHSEEPQPFSIRTSIHVHVNCLDLTLEQTKSIILWYALFEPVVFAMCDPLRRNNIHCVGLDQTVLCEKYSRSLPTLVSSWSKYTALNALPLAKYGTLEFRHMEGHADAKRFEEWLWTLRFLWEYGQKHLMSPDCLQEGSIMKAFDSIFRLSPIRSIRPNVMELCSNNILDIKLSFL